MRSVLVPLAAAAALVVAAGPAFAGKSADADTAFLAGKDADALRLSGEAIAEAQNDPAALAQAYFSRGEINAQLGHTDDALADLHTALTLPLDAQSHTDALLSRAEAYTSKRRLDDALADYDEALRLAPKMVGVHYARARLYLLLKRQDDALKDYDAELALNPTSYRTLSAKATLLGTPQPVYSRPYAKH